MNRNRHVRRLILSSCAATLVTHSGAFAQCGWIERIPTRCSSEVCPGVRSNAHAAFDSRRGVTVVFGGQGIPGGCAGGYANDTWEWNGWQWRRASQAPCDDPSVPSPRTGHRLAYDELRQETILFGGYSTTVPDGVAGDTWAWNGETWTRRIHHECGPRPNSPTCRTGHVMAYDSTRGVIVLFGGWNGVYPKDGTAVEYNDTWEWDGTAWTEVSIPPDSRPRTRWEGNMAYDAARQKMVMFGGTSFFNPAGPHPYGDTWVYVTDPPSWTRRGPECSAQEDCSAACPRARYQTVMAYDSNRGRILLFGEDNGASCSDGMKTWEWDGTTWSQLPVLDSTPVPQSRLAPCMAFDSSRGRIVFFGGSNLDGVYLNDTWEFHAAPPIVLSHPAIERAHDPAACSNIVLPGATVSLIAAHGGYDNGVRYQWRRDGVPLREQPPFTGTASARLTISPFNISLAGQYDLIMATACGSVTSAPVSIPSCPADFNCSGAVNSQDFFDFLSAFFSGCP